jgi:hypothetical protein
MDCNLGGVVLAIFLAALPGCAALLLSDQPASTGDKAASLL